MTLHRHAPLALAATALIVALGGDAIAGSLLRSKDIAKNAITTKHVKNNTLKLKDFAKKERAKLKGDRGAKGEKGEQGDTGPAGAAGAAGANGTNGTNGADGSNATGLTMGTAVVTSASTRFTSLGGTGGGGLSTVEAPGITPNKTLTLSEFFVRVPALLAAETVTVTVQVDNVDTAQTCSVVGTATTCTPGGTLVLPPRTLVGIKLVTGVLGAGTRFPSWSWTFS